MTNTKPDNSSIKTSVSSNNITNSKDSSAIYNELKEYNIIIKSKDTLSRSYIEEDNQKAKQKEDPKKLVTDDKQLEPSKEVVFSKKDKKNVFADLSEDWTYDIINLNIKEENNNSIFKPQNKTKSVTLQLNGNNNITAEKSKFGDVKLKNIISCKQDDHDHSNSDLMNRINNYSK